MECKKFTACGRVFKVPNIGNLEGLDDPSILSEDLGQECISAVNFPEGSFGRGVDVQHFFQGASAFVAPGVEVHVHGFYQLVGDLALDVFGLREFWDEGLIALES